MNIYKNIWKLCLAHTASTPDTLGGNCTIFNEAGMGGKMGGLLWLPDPGLLAWLPGLPGANNN